MRDEGRQTVHPSSLIPHPSSLIPHHPSSLALIEPLVQLFLQATHLLDRAALDLALFVYEEQVRHGHDAVLRRQRTLQAAWLEQVNTGSGSALQVGISLIGPVVQADTDHAQTFAALG